MAKGTLLTLLFCLTLFFTCIGGHAQAENLPPDQVAHNDLATILWADSDLLGMWEDHFVDKNNLEYNNFMGRRNVAIAEFQKTVALLPRNDERHNLHFIAIPTATQFYNETVTISLYIVPNDTTNYSSVMLDAQHILLQDANLILQMQKVPVNHETITTLLALRKMYIDDLNRLAQNVAIVSATSEFYGGMVYIPSPTIDQLHEEIIALGERL